MTFSDLKTRVALGVQRSDLTATLPAIINEALREIQRRRSWVVMHNVGNFTIPNGSSNKSLLTDDTPTATNFKELTIETSPIHLKGSDEVYTPCEVWTREKVLRRQARLISNSLLYSVYSHPNNTRRVQVPVYIDWEAGTPFINVLFSASSALQFAVSYFGYLADLSADGDRNELTDSYPEMVVNKSKAIAFAAVNDPMTEEFEVLYEKTFKEAAAQDAYKAVAGLDLRM